MLLALDGDELTKAILLTGRSSELLAKMPTASPTRRLLRGSVGRGGTRSRSGIRHTNLPVGMLSLSVYPLVG